MEPEKRPSGNPNSAARVNPPHQEPANQPGVLPLLPNYPVTFYFQSIF
ncbi:MAG: hypothetical protein ACI8R4_002632 [Paracoccaceae bacterium]